MNHLKQLFGVDHPVALVTGSGADRVGRAIARHLAESGYRVVLHAHRSIEEVQTTCRAWQTEGLLCDFVTGSIEQPSTIQQWCDEIQSRHAGLHVVVNSAAAWNPTALEELSEQTLIQQWRVNLMGPTLLCRTAGLAMAALIEAGRAQSGAIVNIGDWATLRPYADFAAYLLSKSGVHSMTEIMAVELALRNPAIRVNAVLPGPVMLDASISAREQERIISQSLLKRAGTAEDIAQAVRFLVESRFITGVTLPVDGGRTIYSGPSDDMVAHPTYKKR